jgi:phosphoserine phosphatase RsbU/P
MAFVSKLMFDEAKKDATDITNLNISRMESILRPIEDVNNNLAHSLSNPRQKFDEIHRIARDYVIVSPIVFGSCFAFEPYAFTPDSYYYAPYIYESRKGVKEKMLGSKAYNYFEQDWYSLPKASDKPVWTEPYYDKGGGDTLMCTYSSPFYLEENGTRKFSGVLTMDISLAAFEKIVSSVHVYETGFGILVSATGKIIASPDRNLMNKEIKEMVDIIRGTDDADTTENDSVEHSRIIGSKHIKITINDDLIEKIDTAGKPDSIAKNARKMLKGGRGFKVIDNLLKDGKTAWVYYAPLPSTGWYMLLVFPVNELFSGLIAFLKKLLTVILASILAMLIVTIFVVRRFTRPIVRLADAAKRIGQGDFQAQLPHYKSRNEISQLANSFSAMQDELRNYIENLRETTISKEKIESELNVAHDIQVGMLPKQFPQRNDCDVFAILEPAKAVGGDLYDFFFLDEDLLYFAVGDVSGKSVPASLFMAITRTLFRSKVLSGVPIESAMESINIELCKDNPNVMFVTFQVGILNLKTGDLEVCNAGHNCPFILKRKGKSKKFVCTPNIPLGIFETSKFQADKIRLEPEDTIVMYTDGITEANNIEYQLFREDRLLLSLLKVNDQPSSTIARTLISDVKAFAGEAEQSDDITLIVVKYKSGEEQPGMSDDSMKLKIKNQLSELERIAGTVEELAVKWSIPSKAAMEMNLALEELVTNIIFYAFDDKMDHEIIMEYIHLDNSIKITITDDGKPFDLTEKVTGLHINKPVEERKVGGLGIHFVKKMMDAVEYQRSDNKNIVILTKKISP